MTTINNSKVIELSNNFSEIINQWFTPEQLEEVNRLNQTDEYSNCCATHDFFDTNEAMAEAFIKTFGKPFTFYNDEEPETEKQNEIDTNYFNAAWDMSKGNFFKL